MWTLVATAQPPPLHSTWPRLTCDVGLEEGEYWKISLCYSIVYYYNGAQWYEQFLQVGRLYWALNLTWYSSLSSKHLCVFCLYDAIYILKIFLLAVHPSLYLLVSWTCWDWPLTWLTNHRPSVLWHCWLGHVTRKTVSEMTYYVSSGTLNSTIPYRSIDCIGLWSCLV